MCKDFTLPLKQRNLKGFHKLSKWILLNVAKHDFDEIYSSRESLSDALHFFNFQTKFVSNFELVQPRE